MRKSKNLKIPNSTIHFLQNSVDVKSFGFLEYWILGFRCVVCWIFGFLGFTGVFAICRNRPKIGFGRRQRLRRYLRCFLRGVRIEGG